MPARTYESREEDASFSADFVLVLPPGLAWNLARYILDTNRKAPGDNLTAIADFITGKTVNSNLLNGSSSGVILTLDPTLAWSITKFIQDKDRKPPNKALVAMALTLVGKSGNGENPKSGR